MVISGLSRTVAACFPAHVVRLVIWLNDSKMASPCPCVSDPDARTHNPSVHLNTSARRCIGSCGVVYSQSAAEAATASVVLVSLTDPEWRHCARSRAAMASAARSSGRSRERRCWRTLLATDQPATAQATSRTAGRTVHYVLLLFLKSGF